jgi:hypothetical protein
MAGEGSRDAMEIGPGDFIKLNGGRGYRQVAGNSCFGFNYVPRNWAITTTDGGNYGMYDVSRYFKKEDKDLFKY